MLLHFFLLIDLTLILKIEIEIQKNCLIFTSSHSFSNVNCKHSECAKLRFAYIFYSHSKFAKKVKRVEDIVSTTKFSDTEIPCGQIWSCGLR